MPIAIRLAPPDLAALAREYETNLRHGRALVPDVVEAEVLSSVTLVLERPDGAKFELAARIVMLLVDGPTRGTALEVDVAASGVREALARFVAMEAERVVGPPARADFDALPPDDDADPTKDDAADATLEDEAPLSGQDAGHRLPPVGDPRAARIRKLSPHEQKKLAREGRLEDRVALERAFGNAVWEDLLRNPQLTVPEVARIAAKGTVPRVLLDQIVDSAQWAHQSMVRRALLSNPRLSSDAIPRLLRLVPRHELKQIEHMTAYPPSVRAAAKKLLGS
jgi:hypothetical protein